MLSEAELVHLVGVVISSELSPETLDVGFAEALGGQGVHCLREDRIGDDLAATVAEVEEIVEPGELDPDQIHTPGIYVQRIFIGKNYEKRIEQRTVCH